MVTLKHLCYNLGGVARWVHPTPAMGTQDRYDLINWGGDLIPRPLSREGRMPRISDSTFLFNYIGYEGSLTFNQLSNRQGRPGCMVMIRTDAGGWRGPVNESNFTKAFETAWNVWMSAEELIELGRHMQKIGILSREAEGETND